MEVVTGSTWPLRGLRDYALSGVVAHSFSIEVRNDGMPMFSDMHTLMQDLHFFGHSEGYNSNTPPPPPSHTPLRGTFAYYHETPLSRENW